MKTNSYTKSKARVVNIQGISVSLNCINANRERVTKTALSLSCLNHKMACLMRAEMHFISRLKVPAPALQEL